MFTRFFDYNDNYDYGSLRFGHLPNGPHRVNGAAVLVVHREDDFYVVAKSHDDYTRALGR